MADETTPTDEPTPAEATAPAAEETPATPETPVAEDATADTGPAVLDANIGVAQAQSFGTPAPVATQAPVEETFLATDRVITDHSDPLGTKDQFLGQSGPTPLPLAGANGDVRTAEQKLAAAGA